MESTSLRELIREGAVRAPADLGMPDLAPDLAEDVTSVSDLVIADRGEGTQPELTRAAASSLGSRSRYR